LKLRWQRRFSSVFYRCRSSTALSPQPSALSNRSTATIKWSTITREA